MRDAKGERRRPELISWVLRTPHDLTVHSHHQQLIVGRVWPTGSRESDGILAPSRHADLLLHVRPSMLKDEEAGRLARVDPAPSADAIAYNHCAAGAHPTTRKHAHVPRVMRDRVFIKAGVHQHEPGAIRIDHTHTVEEDALLTKRRSILEAHHYTGGCRYW